VRAAALVLATSILAGCGFPRIPIVVGPPDLDTQSARAPRCEPRTFPMDALLRGDRGNSIVSTEVTREGRITAATLVESSGNTSLDQAAVVAVKRCHFEPLPDAPSTRTVKITVVWDILASGQRHDKPVSLIGVQPSLN
jgi:TonB family protein